MSHLLLMSLTTKSDASPFLILPVYVHLQEQRSLSNWCSANTSSIRCV